MGKILITGGAGFIGSHLVNRLLSDGHNVFVIDNLSTGKLCNLDLSNSKLSYINLDLTEDINSLENLFNKNAFEAVFYYSAVVGVDRTLKNPLLVYNDLKAILNIVHFANKYSVSKLVFASSSEVYGNNLGDLDESFSGLDDTPYCFVKKFGERIFGEINNALCLRFFNVYGSRQSEDFIIGKLNKKITEKDFNLEIFGDGKAIRDFVYIDDNINATMHLYNNNYTGTYNICTGEGHSILDLLAVIEEVTTNKFSPIFLARREDVLNRVGNPNKLIDTGFICSNNLRQGLLKMYLKVK